MLLDGYQEFLIRVAARSSEGLNLQIKTDKIEKRMYNKRQRNDSNRKKNGFMLSSKKLEDVEIWEQHKQKFSCLIVGQILR